jgi:hypothetical protein
MMFLLQGRLLNDASLCEALALFGIALCIRYVRLFLV